MKDDTKQVAQSNDSGWAVGLDAEQQLWVTKDDKPIVVFSADYTRELYMALAAVFADNRAS